MELVENDINQYQDLIPGHYVKMTVRDTGCGVEPDIMDRIFDPYFTTKEVGEGSGMGLAVVHGIVKSHGGDITVHSEPDKGADFHVLFPVIQAEVQEETVALKPLQRGSERILFIDDEESLVYTAKRTLESLGYHVTTQINPLEALEVFRKKPHSFDIIVTDMTMPHMTGDRLAKEVMEIRPGIPVILCSGYSEQLSGEQVKKKGISAFVMKPILVREMAKTIRKVLSKEPG